MRAAGLVDLQVNGFAGVDFNSGTVTAGEVDHALEAMLATGVTTCLPTIITAHPHELAAAAARARRGDRGKPSRAADVPGLSSRRTVPEPGRRLCRLSPARGDDGSRSRPRRPAGERPRPADPDGDGGAGGRGRPAAGRGAGAGRPDRGARPYGGGFRPNRGGGGGGRDALDPSRQRHAAAGAQARQPDLRATRRGPALGELHRRRHPSPSQGPAIAAARKDLRALDPRHRCGGRRRPPRPAATASPAWRSSAGRMARCGSPAAPRSPARRCASTRPCAISWPGGWRRRRRRSPWRPATRWRRWSRRCAPGGSCSTPSEIEWSDPLAVRARSSRRGRVPLRRKHGFADVGQQLNQKRGDHEMSHETDRYRPPHRAGRPHRAGDGRRRRAGRLPAFALGAGDDQRHRCRRRAGADAEGFRGLPRRQSETGLAHHLREGSGPRARQQDQGAAGGRPRRSRPRADRQRRARRRARPEALAEAPAGLRRQVPEHRGELRAGRARTCTRRRAMASASW